VRAAVGFAYREPVAYFEQGLQLARGLPEGADRSWQIVELLLLLGETQMQFNRIQEALQTFKDAAELARAGGSPADLARAALGVEEAEVLIDRPERDSACLLEAALTALGEDQTPLRCRVVSRLGHSLFALGEFARGTALMREGADLARGLGDARALFDALISEWTTTAGQPRSAREFPELRRNCQEILAVAEEIGEPHLIGRALARAVPAFLEMGDIAGFEAFVARLCELSERDERSTSQEYAALSTSAVREIVHGKFAEAERFAERALDAARDIHGEVAHGVYGVQMFTIRREQGRLAEVAPLFRRFLDENPQDAAWRPGLALIASDLGFEHPARKAFEGIAATGFAFPMDAKRNLTLSYLAEVCTRLDDADHAELLYELLLPYRDVALVVPIATVCCGSNARYLGMLASVMGEWVAAEEHFEAALELDERLRAWPWLAHTKHEFGLALTSRSRATDHHRAEALFAAAAASAERIGMPALQQKIRSRQH